MRLQSILLLDVCLHVMQTNLIRDTATAHQAQRGILLLAEHGTICFGQQMTTN